jgi:hypothetical protein
MTAGADLEAFLDFAPHAENKKGSEQDCPPPLAQQGHYFFLPPL